MKNRTIAIITILFALMLVGIIIIQSWWIHRSVQLNALQYDASVYRALEGVVKQTEQKEDFIFVHSAIGFDSAVHTVRLQESAEYIVKHHPTTGVCTLVGDENMDVSPDAATTPMTITDAHLNEKIQHIDTLLQKMVHIKNLDSISINPWDIEELVKEQLGQYNLLDTFNYALFKPPSKFIFQSKRFKDTIGAYKINLYPNDLFGRNVLLFVNIPSRLSRIHGGIWWAFTISLFFIISLLLLFIYSIRMLIRHKNLLSSKNDFINHISHEIKTPLAGISLGADMIIEKRDIMTAEQITKTARTIKEQSARLHKDMSSVLLNALVDESPPLNFTEVDLFSLIAQTLEEFSLIITAKNIIITKHYAKDVITIRGNGLMLQKAFCNLIDNSIKFSNAELVIDISIDYITPNLLQIRFKDNGKGINKKDLSLIFDKFYRSDYYKQSNIQGFGLGLNFVKKVVEMHHGKIRAESEPDKGTTIIIEIPL